MGIAMAFKVFLTYSMNPDEQVIVWRLQTLAAAHGIQVYVPQRNGFGGPSSRRGATPPEGVRSAIDQADCVLAIITSRTQPPMKAELSYALERNRLVIPIVQAGMEDQPFFKQFPQVFPYSGWDSPGNLEAQVVEFLKHRKLSKEKQQAIGGLVAIGLGLLYLLALPKK